MLVFTLIFFLSSCKNQDVDQEKEDITEVINQDTNVEEENNDLDIEDQPVIDEKESEVVPVDTPSNNKFAWGLRRMKDGVQPEFTASYVKPLKDYKGIYVGNKDDKIVYLTFDEGYENGYTGDILDTLKDNEVEATFFITQSYAKKNKELINRMIDEGHILGNHTVNHPSMPDLNDDKLEKEIMDLHNYILSEFEYKMTFIRPPKGEYSERTVRASADLGYTTVLWSFAYDDWDVNNQKGTDYAKKMILNNLHNGAVILLHAVSKDNTEVLDEVIKEIKNRGYEIKPLSEFKY
jgi:peptidoglycan-N-acetylmuramic acid deacetylase